MKGKSVSVLLIAATIISGIVLKTPAIENAQPLEIKNIEIKKEDIVKGVDTINSFGNKYADELVTKIGTIESTSPQQPTQMAESSVQAIPFVKAVLVRVIDGDTIDVSLNGEETSVRFIGIDTPESVSPDASKNNQYGEMASAYTKELLKNTDTVYLQYDASQFDPYGRTLAYVWLNENADPSNATDVVNYMLNATLVNNGYAMDKVFEPNVKYAALFQQLRENAQNMQAGLWQYQEFANLWN